MNFKTLFSICLITICAVVFCACGGIAPLKDNPAKNDMVYSNGGIAVQKGNYIYYMNGYVSKEEVTESSHNKYGNVINGGIYRTKLDNGDLIFDEDEKISNSECVVPKLAGYENGSMYIFGNQLFYSSPNVQKDKHGVLQKDLMDFYMVNIDGTGNKRIYTTDNSEVEYGMKKFGNRVYLLILDGEILYSITINGRSVSNPKKLAEKVTGALWTEQENYDATKTYDSEFDKYVYYTTNAEEGDGNILSKVDITNGEKVDLINDNDTKYDLKAISHNKIYYTKTDENVSNVLYSNTLTSGDFSASQSADLLNNSYANYYVVNGGEGDYVGGILASDSTNGTKFVNANDNSVINVSTDAHDLLFNNGSKIYTRTANSMIYEIDLSQEVIQPKEILSTEANAKFDGEKFVDFTGRYILYYGEYTNNDDETKYYMHIVDMLTATEDAIAKDYLLAKLKKSDIVTEEEDEEEIQ